MKSFKELDLDNVYDKTIVIIHFFYGILFCLLFNRLFLHLYSTNTFVPSEFIELLEWLPPEYFVMVKKIVALTGVLSLFLSTFFPWSRTLRILVFLCLLLIDGTESCYGKIMHGYYGWLFASFTLIFLPKERGYRMTQVFFCAQFSSIICYSMAGLWKVRHIPQGLADGGIHYLMNALGNTIAYEHVTFSISVSPITQFFLDHNYLTGCLFLGLVALQTLSPLLIFFTRFHALFGICFIIFHALSEIIVRIPFRPQMYLVVLFFVFSPFIQWPLRYLRLGKFQGSFN